MNAFDLTLMEQKDLIILADELGKYCSVDNKTKCWKWVGPVNKGTPFFRKVKKRATVASINIFKGINVPKYTRIQCSCGTKDCVNPEHLFIVPIKTNDRIPTGPQLKKRQTQTKQNKRLLEYINKEPNLKGGVVILSGTKIKQATEPYLLSGIANKILICEKNKKNYQSIAMELNKNSYNDIELFPIDVDIMDVASNIDSIKGTWTGFDFDFNGVISETMLNKFKLFIKKISDIQHLWWMRITVTTRSKGKGYKGNNKDFDKLLYYMFSSSFIMIEDLARGPVYNYCDTQAMQTMQVICRRR